MDGIPNSPEITPEWFAVLAEPIHERQNANWRFVITSTSKSGQTVDSWELPLSRPAQYTYGLIWRTDKINFIAHRSKTWFWDAVLMCDNMPVAVYADRVMTRNGEFKFACPLPFHVNVINPEA